MSALRIFSYLPNPRLWKATIAARLCGVEIEVRGAAPGELSEWLWDFDAHPLSDAEREALADLRQDGRTGFAGTLFKTEAFLAAQPFGTVPAAFSPDGRIGIYESNSIMRTVARLGSARCALYGHDAYSASRIDAYLDASLVFARDAQLYILALRAGRMPADLHIRARQAFESWMNGNERALTQTGAHLVDDGLSLADLCFFAEFALFQNERLHTGLLQEAGLAPILDTQVALRWPRALAHFEILLAQPAFAADARPFFQELAESLARQDGASA